MKSDPDINPFLVAIFSSLNTAGIRYTVLRNHEYLPESTGGSDLDIFISLNDKKRFLSILKNECRKLNGALVSKIESVICPRYCFLGYAGSFWGITIDLHIEKITYRGDTLFTREFIFSHTEDYNGIMVLDRQTSALNSFLKEILNNKFCTRDYYDEFISSCSDKDFLTAALDGDGRPEVAEFLFSQCEKSFSQENVRLVSSYLRSKYPGKFFLPLTKFGKVKRILRKPGYSVAFLGTDGSGKSTVIEMIVPFLNQAFHKAVYYEHLRPNYIPSLARLANREEESGPVTDPHKLKPSGALVSLFRFGYYLIDYILGYYLKVFPQKAFKSCIWIFDRYYYDYMIDQHRLRIDLPLWIIRLGQKLIPEPDIIVCLGTDPQVIHKRKPELPFQEIERQVYALKTFSEKHPRAVWIDTGCEIKESGTNALFQICNVMAKRFQQKNL